MVREEEEEEEKGTEEGERGRERESGDCRCAVAEVQKNRQTRYRWLSYASLLFVPIADVEVPASCSALVTPVKDLPSWKSVN